MKKIFYFLLLVSFFQQICNAQNVGIGNTNPQAKLDIAGDVRLRSTLLTLPAGLNNNVDINTVKSSVYMFAGGALGGCQITGFSAGVDGRFITIFNNSTTAAIQLYDESSATNTSTAANKILTGTGNSAVVYQNGSVTLRYDGAKQRWTVTGSNFTDGLSTGGSGWGLTGNAGTTAANFIGTTDAQPLRFGVNGGNAGILDSVNANTAFGVGTLRNLTNGAYNLSNVAMGQSALQNAQTSSGTVAIGFESMKNFMGQNFPAGTLGAYHNTAIGFQTLYANDGVSNTAIGGRALRNNTTGSGNTALGDWSLLNNKTGNDNIALGNQALLSDTSGSSNIAIGSYALKSNLTGNKNIVIGNAALARSKASNENISIGDSALYTIGNDNLDNVAPGTVCKVGTSKFDIASVVGQPNIAIGTNSLKNSNTCSGGNTALGYYTLANGSNNYYCTAVGFMSLRYNSSLGVENTAVGNQTLYFNTDGRFNTAIGGLALRSNTTGSNNVANGTGALFSNFAGSNNIAVGSSALQNNTTISNLVAIGDSALFNNGSGATNSTQGSANAAVGSKALFANTLGTRNTSLGFQTLMGNTVGNDNTAIGKSALTSNTSGFGNTATGLSTLSGNTSGHDNTANGAEALIFSTGSGNTAFGSAALYNLTTGFVNTGIGFGTLLASGNLSNATAIGAYAVAGCSNCMVLGSINGVNTATSNIKVAIGTTTPLVDLHIKQSNETYPVNGGGMRLERQTNTDYWDIGTDNGSDFDFAFNGTAKAYINHTSGAYTVASDFRLKKDIQTVGMVLPSIMQLQPKTYRYKDNKSTDQLSYGFIAQEVEKLFPDFVTTKGVDGMKAIAYEDLNVIAIKAIQEQQTQIEALQKQNADLLIRLKKLEAK